MNREDLQLPNALLVCSPTPLGRPLGTQSRYLIASPRSYRSLATRRSSGTRGFADPGRSTQKTEKQKVQEKKTKNLRVVAELPVLGDLQVTRKLLVSE